MPNIIDSYLVALQFQANEPSLRKFRSTLDLASHSVTDHVSGMSGTVLKGAAAIVGGFVSISAAIVGVVDKFAMMDQGYRLKGLHQLMNPQAAMKLDMVMKGLGDRKSTRLNSSHLGISYAVFCLKKK